MNKTSKALFKVLDVIMIFMLTFGSPMSALAQVWTDPTDYPPGSTVWIQGNNDDEMVKEDGSPWDYLEGETVDVQVDGPGDWASSCSATVDATGYWTCSITLDSDPAVAVGEYSYTATGQVSGKSETGAFTDANIDRDFKQCAQDDAGFDLGECHWINSILQNQNSRYFEGTSVPQRVIFPNLPATSGNAHEMLFFHEFTKGGVHAYDFLTSYAQAQATSLAIGGFALTLNECGEEIPGPNPIDYAGICTAVRSGTYFIDVDVPDDPFVSGSFTFGDGDVQDRIDEFEAQFGNRTIRIWGNAPFTSGSLTLAHDVANGSDTGDSDIEYVLSWVSASTQVVIEMAGHLSISVDGTDLSWGTGKGSGAISGGPYHFKLTEVDNTTIGQEDNQITSGDIISPARKEGMKFNDLNGDGQNDGEPGLEGWEIQIFKDTDGDGVLSATEFSVGPYVSTTTASDGSYGMQIVLTSPPEEFIVCEVAQTGWTQTSPANTVCQAGTGLAPGGWAITLDEGQLDSGNDFGNRELQASILVTKTGSENSKVGDDVTYTVTIENNGEVTVYKQSIIDSLVGDLTDGTNAAIVTSDCGDSLGVGDTCTIEYTYTVQQGDPDPLLNTVTAVYDTLSDLTGDEATNGDDHSVNLFYPSVDVVKDGDTVSKVGDDVDYTITVTNTSSSDSPDLVNGTIIDTLLGDLLDPDNDYVTSSDCTDTLSNPGSCTITATRTVLAGDPDPLPNTVTVHYNPDGFPNDITDSDSHEVQLFTSSVTIDKTGTTLSKEGDEVTYTYTITNTSSVDAPNLLLDSLVDTGDNYGGAGLGDLTADAGYDADCDVLASGEFCSFSVTYTVQAGDDDPLNNTVTVHYHPAGFTNDITDSDDHEVNLFRPSVVVDKRGDDLSKVGDVVYYIITVSNTSSTDTPMLVNGTLVDTLLGDLLDPANPYVVYNGAPAINDCADNLDLDGELQLASGVSCQVEAYRTVLAGDPDPLPNSVTVHFNPLGFTNDITDSDDHEVNLFQPSVTIDKTGTTLSKEGDEVTYAYTITNTSSVDAPNLLLDSLVDTGDNYGGAGLGDLTADAGYDADCDVLASGEFCSFSVTYTVQAGDDDPLNNTVTVHYHPAGFTNDITDSDDHEVNLFQPSITIDKECTDLSKVGDPVNCTVTITNTSSNDAPALVIESIVDTIQGDLTDATNYTTSDCGASLASGASCTITYSYNVPVGADDPYPNTVTVETHPDGFTNDVDATDSDSVNLFQPRVIVDKRGDELSKVGDSVYYIITVSNTSSADTPTLVNGTLTDTLLGDLLDPANPYVIDNNDPGINQCINNLVAGKLQLASGVSCQVEAYRTVQAGDADPLPNTVTVHFNPEGFSNDITDSDDHSVNLFQPSISVVKTGPDFSKVGDVVTYNVTITNTSSSDTPDLVLSSLSDSLAGDVKTTAEAEGCGTLGFGDSCSFSYTYTVQAGDDTGEVGAQLENTVTAIYNPTGFPNEITDNDGSNTWSLTLLHPSFTVTKVCKADTEPIPQEGSALFTVTFVNTGDADLVVTADDGIGTFNLAIGETISFEVSVAGPFSGQATVSNTVNGTVTLDEKYGLDNSYEFSESGSCDVGGRVSLLKLTDGPNHTEPTVDPTQDWDFAIYAGPDGFGTTALASATTLGDADGILDFGNLNLDPQNTYTICELSVPSGWTAEWKVDTDNDGIPDTVVPVYNPNQDDPVPSDLGNRCFDFGAGTGYPIPAGGTLAFQVINTFPGGAPRTPGYWKNWNRCTGGGQAANADRNGGRDSGFTLLEDILNDPGIVWDDILSNGQDIPPVVIGTCEYAVEILDQRVVTLNGRVGDGRKLASDGARTLAMHLLAAQLNEANGACINQDVKDVILYAEKLLDKINFDGKRTSAYLTSKSAYYAYALQLAAYLDAYNNSDCDFNTLPPKPPAPSF